MTIDTREYDKEFEHHPYCDWKSNGVCTSGCPVGDAWTRYFDEVLQEVVAKKMEEVREVVKSKEWDEEKMVFEGFPLLFVQGRNSGVADVLSALAPKETK